LHRRQQRKLPFLAPRPQKRIHILRRTRPLQHLPIQLLPLNLLDTDPPLNTHLRTAVIPAPAAARDQVRHARALLREGRRVRAVAKEHLAEFHHLEQADAHDGRLGVVAPAEAGDEAGGEGDDVFQGAAEGDAGNVGDDGDVEVGPVEEGFDGVVVEGGEVGRLGREADFGGLAFGVFVFGDLGEV